MANIFLKPTAKFNPFSYQEMLAPVKSYTEAYNEADAELNSLMEDASIKAFNFEPQDFEEKQIYTNIMTKLQNAAEQLNTSGLNSELIKNIQNINKEYRKTMIPIQQKINKRGELVAEQRKLQAANPFLRFSKDYSTSNLNDVTDSSTYDVVDLSKIEQLASSEFAGITSSMLKTPKYKSILGNQYYEVTEGYGYTPEEMIEGFKNKDSKIYKFYEDILSKINLSKFDGNTQEEIKQSVINGMMASSGKFATERVVNKNFKSNSSNFNNSQLDISEIDNNTYFAYNGGIYHKDETGSVYKVDKKSKNDNTGDGSPNPKSSSKSASKRVGRPEETITISFNRKGEVKTSEITSEILGNVGKQEQYLNLPIHMQQEVDKYIGEDSTSNYTYYISGKDLTIVPKKITVIQSQLTDIDTELE